MSPTTTTSLKRSRSSTPSLGTPPHTPKVVARNYTSVQPDLATGEPQIKQELDRWENIVFSFRMDGGNQSNSHEYPDEYHSPTSAHLHQLPGGHLHPASGANASGLPAAWDMHPFFPSASFGQHPPYDMLGLGAMNSVPPTHPHNSSPASQDPFGNPWDLDLYAGMQGPSVQPQPLTPAEIAQYHALVARGAAGFALPSPSISQPPTSVSGPSSSSAPPSQTLPARGRSTSSAGRSSSHSQSGNAAVTDEDTSAIAEDKRRRNTAASARFRVKKKQRTMELERTLVELEGRADQLEKEAVELRRENGWLKEMVILKGRKAMENAKAGVGAGPSGSVGQDLSNESAGDDEDDDRPTKGKGKSKDQA